MPRGAPPVLDRLIYLEFPVPDPDDPTDCYGHDQLGPPTADSTFRVWAQRIDAAPRDQLDWDNDARLNVNTAVFVIRWRKDVTDAVVGQLTIKDDEGQRRCVIGRAPIERRFRHLALLCERIS